jgi:hypothetical protein
MADAAGVTHDLTLNGKGYMIAPGSYRRELVPLASPGDREDGVYRQRSWLGRAADAADGESVMVSEGFLPVAGGLGLAAAPAVVWDQSVGGAPSGYGGGVDYAGDLYLAIGPDVYKVTRVTVGAPDVIGTYSGVTSVRTCAATITQLMVHGNQLYACYGTAYDRFNGSAWTTVSQAAGLLASYNGVLIRFLAAAGNPSAFWTLDETTWYNLPIGFKVNGVTGYNGALMIGLDRGIIALTGRLVVSDPVNAPTVYDQFEYDLQPVLGVDPLVTYEAGSFSDMKAYAGWLYYWHGGWLWRWNGQRIGLNVERLPVQGLFYGMAYCQGYLVVVSKTGEDGNVVWLHDGRGWWQLEQGSSSTDQYRTPVGGAGTVKGAHLFCWADGTRYLARWDFRVDGRAWKTGHATPYVILPALEGPGLEHGKLWAAVGLELGVPEWATSLAGSPATWYLDYSTDGGATWTQVLSHTPAALYSAASSAGFAVGAKRLWLRVRCTGGGANNPALRSVWARWGGITATQRRRWTFDVQASDQVVTLTSARDGRMGRQVVADLAALVGGTVVTLNDLDYQATAAGYLVVVRSVELMAARNVEPRGGGVEGRVRVVLEQAG